MSQNASYARFENNPARQYAYYLYAADPSKPITEWIDELETYTGEKVAVRTVQDWRHRDKWETRFAEEVLAASSASVFEQVRRLRVAALPAITYLDRVARGEEKPDRLRMDAAKFLVQQSASVHQLAASGKSVSPDGLDALGNLSDEELRALAAEGRSSL